MLISSYELEVGVSSHSNQEAEFEAIAHLQVDISPVLPYLNATLARALYLPDEPVLSWRLEGRNIGFWPDRIAVDHLDSREELVQVVERLVALVNEAWEKRDQIEPDTSTHKMLQPLEIYKLLPRTNCRRCGQDTCYNFALKLVAAQVQLQDCTPLYEEDVYTEQRAQLEGLLATKWPVF